MGMATMLWVMTSGVGVITAATTKTRSTAYLKFRTIQRAVTRPILDRKKTSVGSSKTRAMPRRTFRAKPKYWATVMTGWKSRPSVRKKRQAQGETLKKGKNAPSEQ